MYDFRTARPLVLSYPLRPDFVAQVVVPSNLTLDEAKRMKAFLLTLARPEHPPTYREPDDGR